MKTIHLPHGTTYLLDKGQDNLETDLFFIQKDEYGQFYAVHKESNKEMHIPRTTAIASKTIEASRFTSSATKLGNEIHKETEEGIKNAYNRSANINKAIVREQQFIHVGKILFTGTVDLLFDNYIGDVKTGGHINHYFYQMLGYAYALGYDFAKLYYFDEEFGNQNIEYCYLSEKYEVWEDRYTKWVEDFNSHISVEKDLIVINKEEVVSEPMIKQAKNYAILKCLAKYFDKKIVFENEVKERIAMVLTNKKVEIWSTDNAEKVSVSVTKKGSLLVTGYIEPTMQEIKEFLDIESAVDYGAIEKELGF